MKYILLILIAIFALFAIDAIAQAPDWIWRRSAGANSGTADGLKVALDSHGNIFLLGEYSKVLIFGTTDDTLYSPHERDMYLAKYDNSGNLLWAKTLGEVMFPEALCIDRSDHIFIGGTFMDSLMLDSITLHSRGQQDFFFAKYDEDGKLIWLQQEGGKGDEDYLDFAVDSTNNILVVGGCADSALFDGTVVRSYGSDEVGFIAKYDTTGSLIWIRSINSTSSAGSTGVFGISINRKGEICIVGSYTDSISDRELFLISKGNSDVFIAKFDSLGNLMFIKSAGGPSEEGGHIICCDKESNIYIGGYLSQSVSNDYMDFDTIRIQPKGKDNYFVAKYNNGGQIDWAKCGGSDNQSNGDMLTGLCSDGDSNIYFSGWVEVGNTFFGNSTFAQSSGVSDIFLAKINTVGSLEWSLCTGGAGVDFGNGITVDQMENVYITGSIAQTGEADMFLGKFGLKSLSVLSQNPITTANFYFFPNPASAHATLNFTLDKSSNITIEIFDLLGRQVKEISLGEMSAGEHSQELDLHGLEDGSYLCRINRGGEVNSTMFTIMK